MKQLKISIFLITAMFGIAFLGIGCLVALSHIYGYEKAAEATTLLSAFTIVGFMNAGRLIG